MSTLELALYYVSQLILQYVGKLRASETIKAQVTPVLMPQVSVQTISFTGVPVSGNFILSYLGVSSAAINYNDLTSAVQTKLRAITGLGSVTVTGLIGSSLIVTFSGVTPIAALLVLISSTLSSGDPTIAETDETLPLAVANAFNLSGSNLASGLQLDTIGKYAGVSRTGPGFNSQITLNDTDFLSLIQMAIIQNSAGSSLNEIQNLIHQFFAGNMLVFDYQNMQMSYLISSAIGSPGLVQLFVDEGLLPRPMAVGVAVIIYAPVINMFFGFRTYALPAFNVEPFNDYASYQTNWPWVSYANAIVV